MWEYFISRSVSTLDVSVSNSKRRKSLFPANFERGDDRSRSLPDQFRQFDRSFFPDLAEARWLDEREDHDLLTRHHTDVVRQADHLDAVGLETVQQACEGVVGWSEDRFGLQASGLPTASGLRDGDEEIDGIKLIAIRSIHECHTAVEVSLA